MLMNYSEYKEGTQESYEELYQELGTLLRMTGYMTFWINALYLLVLQKLQ